MGTMSSALYRRLWLITCLTLLGGLTTLVPVNCVCDADQHWAQSVHPIFQHHHADGHDHGVARSEWSPQASLDSSDAALVMSEHGSFMGSVFDGLLSGIGLPWLALALFPLLAILPALPLLLTGVSEVPVTGPPRPLFS